MKFSTKTLQQLKDLIPRQLTGRYHTSEFPISRFNDISGHLEKYADTRFLTDQIILPIENGITDYALPDRVRQIRGLYMIPNSVNEAPRSGNNPPDVLPDKSNPIRFTQYGNGITVLYVPTASEPIFTENRTINDATDSTLKKLFDIETGVSPLDTVDNLRGKAIIITHASGAVDHLIIAASDNTEQSIRVNGEMSAIPDNDTIYSIYNDFWILEHTIYLPRLVALADNIGVPQDFEEVYRLGMFWHYYAQEGENKSEIDRYQELFRQEKTRFCSDQNRFRSDNFITVPRKIPQIFPTC